MPAWRPLYHRANKTHELFSYFIHVSFYRVLACKRPVPVFVAQHVYYSVSTVHVPHSPIQLQPLSAKEPCGFREAVSPYEAHDDVSAREAPSKLSQAHSLAASVPGKQHGKAKEAAANAEIQLARKQGLFIQLLA